LTPNENLFFPERSQAYFSTINPHSISFGTLLALITSGHSPVTPHYWLRLKDSAEHYLKSTEAFLFLLRCKNTSWAVLLQTEKKQRMWNVFITKQDKLCNT